MYKDIEQLIKACDRADLNTLWSLVQRKSKNAKKPDVKQQELFVELKRMYKPYPADVYWNFPSQDRTISWKFYDPCGVHHLPTIVGVDIFIFADLVYPLSTEVLIGMKSSKL